MNYKNLIIAVLAVAVLVFGGLYLLSPEPQLGIGEVTGPTHMQVEAFTQGFYVGTTRQANINNAGLLTTTGGITNTGALTQTGDVRAKSPVFTGSIGSVAQTAGATTSVITAAQVCDNNYATTTPSITAASTLTTPSAVTLFADCLTTDGDEATLYILNTTASTTVVTAGASTTLVYDGSSGGSATLAASSAVFLRFIRTSATTMYAIMDQYKP